jgi:hypothetical protein
MIMMACCGNPGGALHLVHCSKRKEILFDEGCPHSLGRKDFSFCQEKEEAIQPNAALIDT